MREWPTEQWCFVAATWAKDGAVKLYVDGKLVAEYRLAAATQPADVGETMSIGDEVSTVMDVLTIYNRPLMPEKHDGQMGLPILAPTYARGVWTDVDLMQTMLLAPDVAHEGFSLTTRRALVITNRYLSLGIDQIGIGGDFAEET